MAVIADILSWLAILVGSAFLLIGSLGLLRLPDFYTRLHAAGVIDTLGAELMLLGMMFQAGFSFVTIKLVLIGAFIFITSPTATHAIANAAYTAGLRPQVKEEDPDIGLVGVSEESGLEAEAHRDKETVPSDS